jgi:hypothetical protein
MWDSIKRKSLGQNLDQADSMNKVMVSITSGIVFQIFVKSIYECMSALLAIKPSRPTHSFGRN